MSKLTSIPSARDYLSTRPVNIKPKIGQQNKMRRAANKFRDWFTEQLTEAIELAKTSKSHTNYISLRLSPDERAKQMAFLPSFEGIPGHILLYGHLKNNYWQERNPLVELKEHPFSFLQRLFLKEGWYLIETSDPDKSRYMQFKLHSSLRSLNKDTDYNRTLWHNHNAIDMYADLETFDPEVEEIPEAKKASLVVEVSNADDEVDVIEVDEEADEEDDEVDGEKMDEVADEEIPSLCDSSDELAPPEVAEVDHDSGSDTTSMADEEAVSPVEFV